MGQITVHLLDGFDHDRVVLTVDGRVVDAKDDVTYLLLRGEAEKKLTAAVPDGRVSVGIEVPNRGLARTQELDVLGDVHLLASIASGRLEWAVHVHPGEPGFM